MQKQHPPPGSSRKKFTDCELPESASSIDLNRELEAECRPSETRTTRTTTGESVGEERGDDEDGGVIVQLLVFHHSLINTTLLDQNLGFPPHPGPNQVAKSSQAQPQINRGRIFGSILEFYSNRKLIELPKYSPLEWGIIDCKQFLKCDNSHKGGLDCGGGVSSALRV